MLLKLEYTELTQTVPQTDFGTRARHAKLKKQTRIILLDSTNLMQSSKLAAPGHTARLLQKTKKKYKTKHCLLWLFFFKHAGGFYVTKYCQHITIAHANHFYSDVRQVQFLNKTFCQYLKTQQKMYNYYLSTEVQKVRSKLTLFVPTVQH